MFVKLINDNKIFKINLPENVEGNYWITDTTKEDGKLVNIKSNNGKWIVSSSNYSRIIDEKYIKKKADNYYVETVGNITINEEELNYNKKFFISLKNQESIGILFCSPSYEKNFSVYEINDNFDINIGFGDENDIIYKNDLLKKKHARIFFRNGKYYIENYDYYVGVFINDIFVDDTEKIENGDIICISDVKMMILENRLIILGIYPKLKINYENLKKTTIENPVENIIDDSEEDIELWSENDYFYKRPRLKEKNENIKINIEEPPKKSNQDNSAQFLSLFSTVSMSMVTVITLITTLMQMQSGNMSKSQLFIRIATCGVMLLSMLLLPIIRIIFQKSKKKKYEKKRQLEYRKYINSKILKINNSLEKQSQILKHNNMNAEQCEKIIIEKSNELWERQIQDEDFLNINLGKSSKKFDIGLSETEPKFSLEKDNLLDIYYEVTNNARIMEDAPVVESLIENNIAAFICDKENILKKYMESIILQLVALQNYRELKLIFFVKNEKIWEYVKMLPHIWDDSNYMRFFASDKSDMKEISQYLENIFNSRFAKDDTTHIISNRTKDYRSFNPYYVIISDDYKMVHNIDIIEKILNSTINLGFSLVFATNDITQLPSQCKLLVEVNGDKSKIIQQENSNNSETIFKVDNFEKFDYKKISRIMANIPIKYMSSDVGTLPSKYNFLEMYNCGNIDQLNIFDRWESNDSTTSLQAQIGVDSLGNLIYLDAHEKYHGPHGLIAGTTGSGKSELIITYILSLAVNYHPDDVTFVLIDYKGGGLAGAFKKKDWQLPHLVGTITNIDSVELQRSLESIQSELRRRQIMFNEAKNITNESTIDIYKYQKFYHEGILKKPIPHLFIICDEFAELKQQQPEFMQELMSVSRIGRSLGVHLILATQKPAGIVNDQIRSNSKFGICLKVQDKSDSKDIIKKPDAAYLKDAGQFYINVGNDEYFALGQSAYTGIPYIPSDVVKKEKNNSVEFVSEIGKVIRKIDNKKAENINQTKNLGDQLTNIVKYLSELARKRNIKEKQLWLSPIPKEIYIKDLRKKYNVNIVKNEINPIIGEYDDPFNQLQNVLRLNLTRDGNTIIYGSPDSGKELILQSVLYDSMISHLVEEVQFYILDFGSETLKRFEKCPHIGDVILADDTEKMSRLFGLLKLEIRDRKQKLIDYNGDYKLYLKESQKNMPMIVVIINEYSNLLQIYPNCEDEIIRVTKECMKYGIVFIITANASNEVRPKLLQNFKKKITLQLINEDYSYIFSKVKRKKPSNIYGRGLTNVDSDNIYEFQSSRMCNSEKINEFINRLSERLNNVNKMKSMPIPVIPSVVTIDSVIDKMNGLSMVPIGLFVKNIKPCLYNFEENLINIITAKELDIMKTFLEKLLKEVRLLKDVDTMLMDEEEIIVHNKNNFVERFNGITTKLNSNLEKREDKRLLYIIIGIDKFISNLHDRKDLFVSNLEAAQKCNNCNFIIVDTASKIKSYQFEQWYKKFVLQGDGIYIGNGFDSQYAISYEAERRELNSKCGESFGYVVKKSKPKLIKLLGIEERSEEDE